jgi:hypothetical protein
MAVPFVERYKVLMHFLKCMGLLPFSKTVNKNGLKLKRSRVAEIVGKLIFFSLLVATISAMIDFYW